MKDKSGGKIKTPKLPFDSCNSSRGTSKKGSFKKSTINEKLLKKMTSGLSNFVSQISKNADPST